MAEDHAEDHAEELPLIELFIREQKSYQELQNSSKGCSDDGYQAEVTRLLKSLCVCQRKVRSESIFSVNETVSSKNAFVP